MSQQVGDQCLTTHYMSTYCFQGCRCCQKLGLLGLRRHVCLSRQRDSLLSVSFIRRKRSYKGYPYRCVLDVTVDIHTDTHDSYKLTGTVMAGFNQDTSHFAVSNEYIIGPFDGRETPTSLGNRVNDSKRCNHYQKVKREKRSEQHR